MIDTTTPPTSADVSDRITALKKRLSDSSSTVSAEKQAKVSVSNLQTIVAAALYVNKDILTAKPDLSGLPKDVLEEVSAELGITNIEVAKVELAEDSDYVPRILPGDEFNGMTDLEFLATAHKNNLAVLLHGPPGTGKTSMVEAAIPGTVVVPGTGETETADLVGGWVQKTDGTYEWVDGPLVVAMEAGKPCLIDEIALVDPRVLAVAYSTMDGRMELHVTANPDRGTVKAKPGFIVFGACNPDAPGAMMSEALLSRFQVHVEVLTDWNLAKELKVGSKIITAARNLQKRKEASEILNSPQLRELLTYRDMRQTFGETIALRNFIGQAAPTDRYIYAEVVESVFGEKIPALTM